MYLTDSFPNRS